MDLNVKLLPGQGESLSNPKRYRRLVRKLNYLTITRPDISFPMSVEIECGCSISAKAEYRAMVVTTCELVWIKQLLRELKFG
ncbi:hypothetical protein MTR67_019415 [Solanum verrucosum]|uniref:Uncharacterized protein n=1 Tax=Solanum verrucosum TaxID=315347 RepID=A0AAF0QP49_SOLVR|nr:hypothetical protein MTR67_019415 [Solanum verrucosum]